MSDAQAKPPGGLFLQLVDWMLAPLVVVWPVVVIASYLAALTLADEPFDRELGSIVLAVAEEARLPRAGAPGDDAYPALSALRAVPGDRLLVQVTDRSGAFVAGDRDLPLPPAGAPPDTAVAFREELVGDQRYRVAWVGVDEAEGGPRRVVQVAETISRRRALASSVTNVVMVVMIVVVPVMVGLVWYGLYRGLAPLRLLSARIRARAPNDLSPVPAGDAPEEIAPLVESLNVQLARVQRNLEAQRRFVGDAAHQLRTPLAGLKSQAQMALREWPAPTVRQRLGRIEESAERMRHLATQLLALARADDLPNRLAASEPVDLDALLRGVCGQYADEALARGKTIALEPSPGGARVEAVPDLLRELFANLIDNAIRYSRAGEEVTVRVTGGRTPSVAVEDAGPGIPLAERETVFERFYRVLGTDETGSGLGLAIAREIVLAHGAAIAIEDRPGGGARVVVTFAPPGKP